MTDNYLLAAKAQLDRDLVPGHPLRRVVDELIAAEAEIVYLRRQIELEENWRDPEFGGCMPDPQKPEHLKEKA